MSSTTPQGDVLLAAGGERAFPAGTPIGVDIGLRNLLALAPADAAPDVAEGRVIDAGGRIEAAYTALQGCPDRAHPRREVLTGRLRRAVTDILEAAVAYAASFDAPVLAVEELGYPGRSLADCIEGEQPVECWLYPVLQHGLTAAAVDAGIPVVSVSAKHTTQQCHQCLDFARVSGKTIQCTTSECPVGEVCRDLSAAVTIAGRVA